MDITQQLTLLAELSRVEAKIGDVKLKLKTLPAVAREAREGADAKQAEVQNLENQHFDLERSRRTLDQDTQAERDKLRKWQNRADQIRGDREHAALQSEIGAQKRSISRLEENSLEIMQEMEDIEKAAVKAREEAASAKEHADSEWSKVEAEVKELEEELAGHERGRDAMLEKLPPALVKKYQRIAERKGAGVAVVTGETCGGCSRQVRPQLVLQLYKGEVIETCEQCQRILVHSSMTHANAGGEDAAEASA
jgi:predicted  nucleic acid-binding Zn-ribbon protein